MFGPEGDGYSRSQKGKIFFIVIVINYRCSVTPCLLLVISGEIMSLLLAENRALQTQGSVITDFSLHSFPYELIYFSIFG